MVCESPSGLALGRAGCRLAAVSHRPDGQGRELGQLIADVEGSEPETAGILLAHIDELGQALNQHYRPAQSRFSGDSDQ